MSSPSKLPVSFFLFCFTKKSYTYDFTQDHILVGACEHKSSQKLLQAVSVLSFCLIIEVVVGCFDTVQSGP